MQVQILSAQFDEFKFWLVAGLALLGVVAAVIVAAASAYVKNNVKNGIIAGVKEAQKAIDKTAELEGKLFKLSQKIEAIEMSKHRLNWQSLTLTAPTNGPVTGFGKCSKTEDGVVLLYIDTYCDSATHPITILPDGFRPRRTIEISICAIDIFNYNKLTPITGIINSNGEVYAHITSDGMQCPINTTFICSDNT